MPKPDLSPQNMDVLDCHPGIGQRLARMHFRRVISVTRDGPIVVTKHGEPQAAFVSVADSRAIDWVKRHGGIEALAKMIGNTDALPVLRT